MSRAFTGNDMIFNDYNFSNDLYVENIRRPLLAPIENTLQQIGRHGSKHVRARTGSKHIEVDVRIIRDNKGLATQLKELVAGRLVTHEPKKLILRDTSLWDMAILDGSIDYERWLYTGFSTLNFLNPSGISYGQRKELVVQNNGSFTYQGSLDSKPIIRITPNTTNQLIVELNGEYLEIRKNLSSSNTIVFGRIADQMEYQEIVTIDGVNAMPYLTVESDFVSIKPGMNQLKLTGAQSAQIEFWERYA